MFELLCELQTICDDIFYGCGFSKKKSLWKKIHTFMFDIRSKPPVISPLYAPISPNMTQYSATGVRSPHLSQR